MKPENNFITTNSCCSVIKEMKPNVYHGWMSKLREKLHLIRSHEIVGSHFVSSLTIISYCVPLLMIEWFQDHVQVAMAVLFHVSFTLT